MRPGAFLLSLFLGSSFGMSTFIPAVEVNEITSTEMTTEMTSVDGDQGSGMIFYVRMMFTIRSNRHLIQHFKWCHCRRLRFFMYITVDQVCWKMSWQKYTGLGQHLFVLEDVGDDTESSRGTRVEIRVAAGWAISLSAGVFITVLYQSTVEIYTLIVSYYFYNITIYTGTCLADAPHA